MIPNLILPIFFCWGEGSSNNIVSYIDDKPQFQFSFQLSSTNSLSLLINEVSLTFCESFQSHILCIVNFYFVRCTNIIGAQKLIQCDSK